MYSVGSREECRQFATWLVRYPMPVTAPKARQLSWWISSLNARFEHMPRSQRRRCLARYEGALRQLRTYAGPRQLCSCPSEEASA